MHDPRIRDVRIALIEAALSEPIVVPIGKLTVRRNLLVLVELEGGCVGLGEIWANFPPWGCADRIQIVREVFRPALRGEVLDDPTRLHDRLFERIRPLVNQLGAAGPFHQALAGVDIALWDARARWDDLPLSDLIRRAPSPRSVEVYATNLPITQPTSIEEVALRGQTRFKVRLPQDVVVASTGLDACRSVAGDRHLMADATQGYSPRQLEALLPVLRRARLSWLEEPFPVDDPAAYASWKQCSEGPPVAMGENSYGLDGFDRLLADFDPAIVQPDITKTGGISRGKVICERMAARRKRVCLHMYGGPVGLYASAHLTAAIESVSWLEMEALPNPIFERILDAEPIVRDGELSLPPGPGIGSVFREDVMRAADVTDR